MQKFKIAGYRHERLARNGIYLAFTFDETDTEPRSLSSEMTESQARQVVSLAQDWIVEFRENHYSPAPHHHTGEPALELKDLDLNALFAAARMKRKNATFQRDVLLKELVSNAPTPSGKLNICLEVILSGIDSPRESQIVIHDFHRTNQFTNIVQLDHLGI